MRLVADRFAVQDDDRAFDLATGRRVTLIVADAGAVSDQLQWTARCDALHVLRHRAVAPLLDYELVGESSRFEAWGCGAIVGRRDHDEAVATNATQWLQACGLSIGNQQPGSICVG